MNEASCPKSANIILPRAPVKVDRQEPASFVSEKWVGAHHMLASKMPGDFFVSDSPKRLMGTTAARSSPGSSSTFYADSRFPLVGAGGGVTGYAGPRVLPANGKHIVSASKQSPKKSNLVRIGERGRSRRPGLQQGVHLVGLFREGIQLLTQCCQPGSASVKISLQFVELRLFPCNLVDQFFSA